MTNNKEKEAPTNLPINFRNNPEILKMAHGAREQLKGYIGYRHKGDTVPQKYGQELPIDVLDFIASIPSTRTGKELRNSLIVQLIDAGWTKSAVARAVKVSRQQIENIFKAGLFKKGFSSALPIEIPSAPTKQLPSKYIMFREPTPELLARLKELQPMAQLVRSNSPKYREEAEEYTRLLNEAVTTQGVTPYRLGKLLGITHSAINFRLTRYGYKTTTHGKTKAWRPIIESHRVKNV